jgi:outer membrane protein
MGGRSLLSRSAAVLLAGISFTAAPVVLADTLFGIYAGAGTWQQNYSGDVRSGVTTIDVENDLNLDEDHNNVFYVAVEHPAPFLPNVRVNYVSFNVDSESVLSSTIEFNDVIFPVDSAIATDVDMKQADAVLYYELLDSVVSLDVGFGARYMDGRFSIVSDVSSSEAEFTVVVPMLYGRTRADLPLTGFWVGGEVMGMGYSGNSLVDATAQVGWESSLGLGAELGWRFLGFDLDDVNDFNQANVDVSGPYMALNFHF